VFPHGGGSAIAGLTRLRSLCPGVEEHQIYETVSIAPGPTAVDAVAFGSPSAVRGWMLSRDLEDLVVAATGETTAAAVAHHRVPYLIAPTPSYRSLARVLSGHFEVEV
jgi:uroporphyrinogen-III synthase